MAIKSITVTEDAYEALKAMKSGSESFSRAILRLASQKRGLPAECRGLWKRRPDIAARIKARREAVDGEAAQRLVRIRKALA